MRDHGPPEDLIEAAIEDGDGLFDLLAGDDEGRHEAHHVAAGERHHRALEILDLAVRRDCVLTLQALAEFFYVTTRKRVAARIEAAVQLRDWATEFPIVAAEPEALSTALEFAVIYIRQLTPILTPLLLIMSAGKFALIVMYFMHLRYDTRPLTFLFVAPLVLAIGLALALMTLSGEFLLFGR